jgi:type II secretory pathway predicted ATPase ExeA
VGGKHRGKKTAPARPGAARQKNKKPGSTSDAARLSEANGQSRQHSSTRGDDTTMNRTKEYLETEHLKHFGLTADPFFELEDHRDIWMPGQLEGIKHLIRLTAKTQGMMALTGEIGSGKSTMLRHVVNELLAEGLTQIIMPDRLDRKALKGDMLTLSILDHMITPSMKVPQSTIRRDRLAKDLLTKAIKRGEQPLLVLDEAHDLQSDLLISLKRSGIRA